MSMSSDPFQTYNRVFLSLFLLLLFVIFGLLVHMKPLVGELTRMGGYLENQVGWTTLQEHFPQPLFTRARSIEEYDRPFDVVVFGDSFSDDLSKGWQNYLAAATGWSIITFNMNEIDIDRVLSGRMYRSAPPRLFIYESVERNFIGNHDRCPDQDGNSVHRHPEPLRLPPANPLAVEIEWISMDGYPQVPLEGIGITNAVNYLRKALYRRIPNFNPTEVHEFKLSRGDLFSNAVSDRLLVLTRDFKNLGITPHQIATAKCSLMALQSRIEAAGWTTFLTLGFPDKTTAYADYIDDPMYRNMSVIGMFENEPGLHMTKLKDEFKAAVENGVIDFYLPNDSHCGYLGYQMAAYAVLGALGIRDLVLQLL